MMQFLIAAPRSGSGKTTVTCAVLTALQRRGADPCAFKCGPDYKIHDRSEKTVTVKPAKVVVVEGILIFQSPELCDLMDIKIYVDTDADVRILRRIIRDVRDRGRSLDNIVNQYLTTVKPMHEQFVEPSKRKADIIIPEGGHNQVALEMVIERVRAHLSR